jgi:hypothetical protein
MTAKKLPKVTKDSLKDPNALLKGLFKEQVKFVTDKATFKVACCGRRAGKSYACGIYLYHAALSNKECISVYLGLTRSSSKRIMWAILKKISRDIGIPTVFEEASLTARLPNGSEIWVMGANDESTAENLRGNSFKLVIFDECSSWRGHLERTIDEIIVPAILDRNGQIALIGTPSVDFKSLFYNATHTLPEYEASRHHWTVLDNPFMKGKQFIASLKRQKKWADDNPVLLREFMGKWVRVDSDLVYRYNPNRNTLDKLPDFPLVKVMGIDVGFVDADAIEVLGYNPDQSNKIFRIDGIKIRKQGIHALAQHIVRLKNKYNPAHLVMDEGGLGKKIAEELRLRYSLPITAADKTQKLANIEFLNADLEESRILIQDDSSLAEEWRTLTWSDDSRTKEDGHFDNHSSDAFLYAYKKCKPYLYCEPEAAVKLGSSEYWEKIEDEMLEVCMSQLHKEDNRDPDFEGVDVFDNDVY